MTSNTQIHDHSVSWLGTDTSIKSGGVKLAPWAQASPLSEMKQCNRPSQSRITNYLDLLCIECMHLKFH